jgi:hypothetical protein
MVAFKAADVARFLARHAVAGALHRAERQRYGRIQLLSISRAKYELSRSEEISVDYSAAAGAASAFAVASPPRAADRLRHVGRCAA